MLIDICIPSAFLQGCHDHCFCSFSFSLSIQGRTLINIWIPSAFLRGTSSDQFHVYQVYVRIKDEEWNVFRRYSQFLDLHARLKKVYPIISKFEFPPKKSMGSKVRVNQN